MIRQAISCDICGTEKKQTNHWFVAYDTGGELRVSGWNSRNRLRPGSKHLCGQTCLHKLVDDFMARALSSRPHSAAVNEVDAEEQTVLSDTSLTSGAAHIEVESSARVLTPPTPILSKRPLLRLPVEPEEEAGRHAIEAVPPSAVDEPPSFSPRNWRAEAWERERERELRAVDRRPDISARRRANS